MTTRSALQLTPHAILSAEERAMLATYVEERVQQGQVPFELAASITGLPAELLRKLVRDGVLKGWAAWRTEHVEGHCDISEARHIATQLTAARELVEGHGIMATEAEGKYGFAAETIYRWHRAGWVKAINEQGKRNRLFNEGDIAFAQAIVKLTGHSQGKKVFPKRVN